MEANTFILKSKPVEKAIDYQFLEKMEEESRRQNNTLKSLPIVRQDHCFRIDIKTLSEICKEEKKKERKI